MRHWLTVPLVLAPLLLARCAPAPPPYIGCCAIPPRNFTVYFTHGGVELNERSQQAIREAAAYLIARPEKRMKLTGYNDLSDGAEANPQISRRRADAVAAALIKLNVPRERLDARGGGASNPVVPAARGKREPQNRRVELLEDMPGISRIVDPPVKPGP